MSNILCKLDVTSSPVLAEMKRSKRTYKYDVSTGTTTCADTVVLLVVLLLVLVVLVLVVSSTSSSSCGGGGRRRDIIVVETDDVVEMISVLRLVVPVVVLCECGRGLPTGTTTAAAAAAGGGFKECNKKRDDFCRFNTHPLIR